jgi:3-oxoadipate enol-lactonase
MPSAEVNGTELHYDIEGPDDAPPLLLCNSLGTNLHMWDWQMPAFAERFRVIRYDRRGHGRSAAPEGPYSFEMLAGDALGLLDLLNIESTNFCGLSMGGMVGQRLGALVPERIERLVLCNTASHLPPAELWDERIEAALTGGMDKMMQPIIDRWFTARFQQSNPGDVTKVADMVRTTPKQGYAACCMAIRDMDQRELLPQVAVPTLVVVGDKDPATTPQQGEYLHAKIPGAELAVLDAAHLSNIEASAEFTRQVLAFLTTRRRS